MRALIAHRRLVTSTDGTQVYELAIGTRNFACFNGFNVEGAFNKQNDPEVIHMVTALNGDFRNSPSDWLETQAKRNHFHNGKTLGAWECVGIGWLYNGARAVIEGPMHGRVIPSSAKPYDFAIGNALRREGFMSRYYDAWNGAYKSSIRQLTPMEQYLNRVFSQFEVEDRRQIHGDILRASPFASAVNWNSSSAGCLYQFVGSERSSGQAVAFLQTFRNVSEVQYTGWVGANAVKYSILIAAYNAINRSSGTESIYPLMDHLVNYGTDNAITCYAGTGVVLHGMKYGFWTLAEFFHRTESMVVEGRYNKGAQSSNLGSKYNREAHARNVYPPLDSEIMLRSLKEATAHPPIDLAGIVTYESIMSHASRNSIEQLITTVTGNIRNTARADQTANINRLVAFMREHGDARRPPEPVAPPAPAAPTQGAAQSATPRNTTAGAAVGFVQWTSTAVH